MYKPTYHTLSKRGYITLLALLVSIITFAQSVTVKGTILDENKEPLIGATVQVKGETTGFQYFDRFDVRIGEVVDI